MNERLVASWKTRGGRHWYELYEDSDGCYYRGDGCGGNLGNITALMAMEIMKERVWQAHRYSGINYKCSDPQHNI